MVNKPLQTPPPLPDDFDSEVDHVKVILAVAGIFVLIAILAIALMSTDHGIADGTGDGGNVAASAAGEGSGDSANETDNDGKQGESSESASTENDSDSTDSGLKEEASDSKGTSSTPDITQVSVESNQANEDEQALQVEVEDLLPKSNRKVRNTFNPFGSSAPPKKAGAEEPRGEEGKSADFFGVDAEGKSFVYVVDKSSSMMGGKFEAARQELMDSIDDLKPNQAFFVIFFDSEYHPQPSKGILKATFKNKRNMKAWMMNAMSYGGTEPQAALKYALDLHPDAIFVLSDGEFDPYVVSQVTDINKDFTIPIHTIGFQSNARTLKDLANQNRGKYRFVP